MELNEIIKKIRTDLKLSQEGFARELHVGFSTVNRWKRTKQNQIKLQGTQLLNFVKKKILAKS